MVDYTEWKDQGVENAVKYFIHIDSFVILVIH